MWNLKKQKTKFIDMENRGGQWGGVGGWRCEMGKRGQKIPISSYKTNKA